ncbi:MAG: hypothetical protein IJO57_04305 [Bacilli bacterium]|nr:hypothetical protein [Bacilli bacterium]
MKNNYILDYVNENEFRKKERAVKKYNMLAYKKLLFEFYPALREGNFLGVLVSSNREDMVDKYELTLPTDKTFTKVHGHITLHYSVYLDQKTIVLETLTPEDILTEGHQKELTAYKGVMVSKSHKELDMFKINLLESLDKKGFFKLPNWLTISLSIISITFISIFIAKLMIK